MNILVTGASGFIGSQLVPLLQKQGHDITILIHNKKQDTPGCKSIYGDILKTYWEYTPTSFDAVYHLAGIINLGKDPDRLIERTNAQGTKNVVDYCLKTNVPHLYFCSTAYADGGRNSYENSKKAAEIIVMDSKIPKVTIFKPSLVLGGYQHLSQYVSLLINLHRRAELIRRKIEGKLRLPVIEPVFRIKGNPDGSLNLVKGIEVAQGMSEIKWEGSHWLVNPHPPKLSELVEWVGEFSLIDLRIEKEFKATPLESIFARYTQSFNPYLQGDDLHPMGRDGQWMVEDITKEYIHEQLKRLL
jgi:hypothetical protein